MKITKQVFCEILGMLEEDNIIDNYTFMKNENKLYVYSNYDDCGNEEAIYSFNEKNELIDPRIKKLQKQLEELERQKKDLENKIKLLTNN